MERRSPFGELVLQYRSHLGLSQEGLARRINTMVDAGNAGIENRISAKTIYNHEARYPDASQFRVPRVGTIGIYADAFGLATGSAERQRFIDAAEETRRLKESATAARAWLLPGVDARPETSPSLSPDFVIDGREQPWAALQHALDAALSGRPQTDLLEGEAGIGKTRLLAELGRLAERAHGRLTVAWGRCIAPTPAPYNAVREVLRLLIGDLDGAGSTQILSPATGQRLRTRAPDAIDALMNVGPATIGSLLDPDTLRTQATAFHLDDDRWRARFERLPAHAAAVDPGMLHSQIAAALCRYAAKDPLVIIIDDLHWATSGTLQVIDLLAHILRDATNLPFLLLGAYRPEAMRENVNGQGPSLSSFLADIQRQWPDGVIDLAPSTNPTHGRAFIGGRLDLTPNHLDAAFRDALFAKTGGLPLLVENALWTLQTNGQLRQDASGALTLHGTVHDLDLSPSIRAMIGQRLAGLDVRAREALDIASVQGEVFFADPVIAIMKLTPPAAAHLLDTVLNKHARLVVPAGVTAVAGTRVHKYQFAHALYRDYLFDQLGALRREQHQAATAQALAAIAGATPSELSAAIADLFEQAGEETPAAYHHRLAGTYDLDTRNPECASRHFEQAIALADQRTQIEEIGQAMLGVVRGLRMTGQHQRAIVESQRTLTFSRANDLPEIEVFSLIWLGLISYDLGQLTQAEAHYVAALPLLRALSDAREECRAETLLAHVLYGLGRYDEAIAHADRALELADGIRDDSLAAESRLAAGNCLLDLGRFSEAIAMFETAIARYRRVRDLRGEGICRADIGLCLVGLARWPDAAHELREARAIGERLTALRLLGHVELYAGLVNEGEGDSAAARSAYLASLRLRHRAGQAGYAIDALAGLLRVTSGRPWYARRLVWGIGRYLEARGAEGIEEPFRVAESCVEALEALGEAALARRLVEASVALMRERADHLASPADRASYLDHVPCNRALRRRAAEAGAPEPAPSPNGETGSPRRASGTAD